MIFNIEKIVETLNDIKFHYELNSEQYKDLNALVGYFANQEPKLTFDEFKRLFNCDAKYLDEEKIEINIVPKRKVFVYVDKSISYPRAYNHDLGISINPELEEHLLQAAYMQFKKSLEELENE